MTHIGAPAVAKPVPDVSPVIQGFRGGGVFGLFWCFGVFGRGVFVWNADGNS